jgi:hypothetical protein
MVVSLYFFLNYSSRIHLLCISFEHVIHSLHVEASYLSLPIACMGGFMRVSVPILYPMHPFSYSVSSLSSLSTFILSISPLPAYFCPFFYVCPLALFCVVRVQFFCQHLRLYCYHPWPVSNILSNDYITLVHPVDERDGNVLCGTVTRKVISTLMKHKAFGPSNADPNR